MFPLLQGLAVPQGEIQVINIQAFVCRPLGHGHVAVYIRGREGVRGALLQGPSKPRKIPVSGNTVYEYFPITCITLYQVVPVLIVLLRMHIEMLGAAFGVG